MKLATATHTYTCDQYQFIGVGVIMWEVQKLSELKLNFKKVKSSSSSQDTLTNHSALSETRASDLSDYIRFRSEITELQKSFTELLIRIWRLQGKQGNIPHTYLTDIISMITDLIHLDIRTTSPPSFLKFEQEVRNLPTVITRSEPCDMVEELMETTFPLPGAGPVTRD